jgi:hypothetical protein
MNVTLIIPDALAARLGAEADLPRRALEALSRNPIFRFARRLRRRIV